jgi:sortase B
MKNDNEKGRLIRSHIISLIFYPLLVLAVVAVLMLNSNSVGAPRILFGYAVLRVTTGSMEREIPQGSLILIKRVPPESLLVGDNITFLERDLSTTTHQIVEIYEDYADGYRGFRTQGVENLLTDPEIVIAPNVVGKVVGQTTLFVGIIVWLADIWDFLLAYPVFLVLFPLLIGGLIISLKVFFSIKVEEEDQYAGGRLPPLQPETAIDSIGQPPAAAQASTAPRRGGNLPPVTRDTQNNTILPQILSLRKAYQNEDIVGHISIEGTAIEQVVLHSTDNERYQHLDARGNENPGGAVFMDFSCDPERLGRHTVLYGKALRGGGPFSFLRDYEDREFFQKHRYLRFATLYEESRWEVFAFDVGDNKGEIPVHFADDEGFEAYVYERQMASMYVNSDVPGAEGHILTLASCSSGESKLRFTLSARLVSQG